MEEEGCSRWRFVVSFYARPALEVQFFRISTDQAQLDRWIDLLEECLNPRDDCVSEESPVTRLITMMAWFLLSFFWNQTYPWLSEQSRYKSWVRNTEEDLYAISLLCYYAWKR